MKRQFALLFVAFVAMLTVLQAADPPKKVEIDPEVAALAAKLKDKSPKVRLKAVEDLAALGDKAAPVADAVCDATMDANGQIGLAALASLEKIRPDLYRPLLVILVDKEDMKTMKALSDIGSMGEDAMPVTNLLAKRMSAMFGASNYGLTLIAETRPTLGSAQASTINYRQAAKHLEILEIIKADHPAIVATKMRLAKTTNANYEHRIFCLKNLIDNAAEEEDKKKIVPLIAPGLQRPGISEVAVYAKMAGSLGKSAAGLLPTLKKLKLSQNETVRDAATASVEQIEADQ